MRSALAALHTGTGRDGQKSANASATRETGDHVRRVDNDSALP